MKKDQNRCPGCSKHCPLEAPKCKYGCKYRLKLQAQAEPKRDKMRKWEKWTQPDGVIARMLHTSRRIKKTLLKRKITDLELVLALSPQEQESLISILVKLDAALPQAKKKKHV